MVILMIFQALIGSAGADIKDVDFDLRNVPRSDDSGAIVVTARKRDDRLKPLEEQEKAPFQLPSVNLTGNLRAAARVDQRTLDNGMISKRVMIDFKLPF